VSFIDILLAHHVACEIDPSLPASRTGTPLVLSGTLFFELFRKSRKPRDSPSFGFFCGFTGLSLAHPTRFERVTFAFGELRVRSFVCKINGHGSVKDENKP
jgi:hypothetical protein